MALASSPGRTRVFEGAERPRRPGSLEARQIRPKGPTLEERIAGTWTQLVESGTAACPVCRTSLSAAFPCARCGSELS